MAIVTFEWLNNLEITVIVDRKHLKKVIKANKIKKELLSLDDWDDPWVNGLALVLEIKGYKYFVIMLKDTSDRVLVHESVHMVHYICDEKMIPLVVENSETIAYMTDYLYRKLKDIVEEKR